MKSIKSIKRSLKANKNVLIAIAIVLIGSVIYNSFNTTYHAKEIDALKDSIALKEKEVQVVLGEKEKYQDSSAHFEQVALQYDHKLVEVKHKVEVLKQQKAEALHALNDIPKDVIDSFFVKRYAHVQKVDVDLGPTIGYIVSRDRTETITEDVDGFVQVFNFDPDSDPYAKGTKLALAVNLGTNYNFTEKVYLGFRYSLFIGSYQNIDNTIDNSLFDFSLGYNFK